MIKNKEILIAGVTGLVIGVFIAPVLSPVMPMMRGWNLGRGPMMGGQNTINIDRHFIEQMIPHHEDAIVMATLALAKAEHAEIKILSSNIIRTQSEEIDKMKEWYKSWFGKDVPNISRSMGHGMGWMMHGGMMGDTTDLQSLERARPFDEAFIEEMIPHHQMAVMMAQMLQYSTDRSDMKNLAEDIIKAQTSEINQMRQWYNSWYAN